jgi:hypothetical protein
MAAWRASGRQPEELNLPDVPGIALGVYQAWRNLSESRPSGFGKAQVSYGEIDAWQRVNNVRLTPWELETLIEMDRAGLQASGE